jgi:hypothetical protein
MRKRILFAIVGIPLTIAIGMAGYGDLLILILFPILIFGSVAELIKKKKTGESYSGINGIFEKLYGRTQISIHMWLLVLVFSCGYLFFLYMHFIND